MATKTISVVVCDLCGYKITKDGKKKDVMHKIKMLNPSSTDKNPNHSLEICFRCYERIEKLLNSVIVGSKKSNDNAPMLESGVLIPKSFTDAKQKRKELREEKEKNIKSLVQELKQDEIKNKVEEPESIYNE